MIEPGCWLLAAAYIDTYCPYAYWYSPRIDPQVKLNVV